MEKYKSFDVIKVANRRIYYTTKYKPIEVGFSGRSFISTA
jgi:hypothetical protein